MCSSNPLLVLILVHVCIYGGYLLLCVVQKKKNAHGGAHVGQGMDVFITCRPGMSLPIVDVHVYQCG